MNFRKPLKLKEEPPVNLDHERQGRGRRASDMEHTRRIEIHPWLLGIGFSAMTALLSIIGYFVKGWAEDVKTELHGLRSVVEKQSVDAAANSEWKTNMSRWRDEADQHFKDIDYQLAGRGIRKPQEKEKDAMVASTSTAHGQPQP